MQRAKTMNKTRNQQFRRIQMSMARKANGLVRDYGAAVVLIVEQNGRFYVYRSMKAGNETSFVEKIQSSYPLPVVTSPSYYRSMDKSMEESMEQIGVTM